MGVLALALVLSVAQVYGAVDAVVGGGGGGSLGSVFSTPQAGKKDRRDQG